MLPDKSLFRSISDPSNKANLRVFFVICLLAFSLLVHFNAGAQGNLLVTPMRVIFEGNKRSFDLNLANVGKDTATYSISLVQIRMKEDGSFELIDKPDPGQNFADQYIRFFPRTVTLPPNEAQVVKVQLVRANQLAKGEYRSHFYFRAVPKARPLGEVDSAKLNNTISVRLTPIFGITIPAIIRIGESDAKVTISDLALEINNNGPTTLGFKLNRSGNFSVYGNLAVDYVSSQGKKTRVAEANGLAVYTPNLARNIQLTLNKVADVDFKVGKLQITYSASSDVKPVKLAEAEFILR